MASFSVTWSTSNGGKNLEELQGCLNHTQSSRPGMSFRKNFVSYGLRNRHMTCNAQNLSSSVLNNFSGNSAARSDEYLPSSSFSPYVVDHGHKISPTRKRMVDKEEDFSGKLDQWVKDSVVEIVNFLDEAPFLVYIYSDGEEGSSTGKKNRFVKEKAFPERWPAIKERWGRGGRSPTPSGIILVEEIDNEEEEEEEEGNNLIKNKKQNNNNTNSCNRVWGILIQGKGANYPVCYLLKTCRVASVSGFCTHFCLAKVECFVEALDLQFMKLWLL